MRACPRKQATRRSAGAAQTPFRVDRSYAEDCTARGGDQILKPGLVDSLTRDKKTNFWELEQIPRSKRCWMAALSLLAALLVASKAVDGGELAGIAALMNMYKDAAATVVQPDVTAAASAGAPASPPLSSAPAVPGELRDPESWIAEYATLPAKPAPLPPPLGLPQPTVGAAVLVNAPGTSTTGGPRCLDHFGARFPMATGLVAGGGAETDVWSCAAWVLDLPLVRSGRFGRLCLTRVAAGWGAPSTAAGAVARPCGLAGATPIPEQQWKQTRATLVAAAGAAAGQCLTAPTNACRQRIATSAEMAPCGGALAPLQDWVAASAAPPAATLLTSTALAQTLAACTAHRAATFKALAKKNRAGGVALIREMDTPGKPRLLVNGMTRLCMQPRRKLDGTSKITTHRCAGMGWDLKLKEAAAKLSPRAKFDPAAHRAVIPGVEWVFRPDERKHFAGNEYGVLHLAHTPKDAKGRLYPKLAECLTCVACAVGSASAARLTLAPCNGSAVQMWLFDYNKPPATYRLRPRVRQDYCVAADNPGTQSDKFGPTVHLHRCVSGDPLQRWGPLRLEISHHAPTATITEAFGATNLPPHVVATEEKVASAFPGEWLSFRNFQDVYDPVPTPYLAWLARHARAGTFGVLGTRHVDQLRVKEMRSNATTGRPFKNVFSMALFVPAPVTEEDAQIWGPVLEVDKKFAKITATMAALLVSKDIDAIRASPFYERYVTKMINCITFIRTRLPEWSVRVHLSPELEQLAGDILAAGNVQVAIMSAPSMRTAGAFWRWIAFDDTTLDTVIACDSDEADGTFGGTILSTLWSGVEAWRAQGPDRGHAIFRWFTGWTELARTTNSHSVQYSPIQANVVMAKPKVLTWSVRDSMVGFSVARIPRVWERRFYPYGETRVHQFSRVFDRDPIPMPAGTAAAGPYYPNLGWGRRYQEYGYDEAWTKHVLYYRSVAEGTMFSIVPRRDMESEIASELTVSGLERSDANAVLRCANAWFLDGVEAARYPGNAIFSTNGFGTCDSHSTGQPSRVAPCHGKEGFVQKWNLSPGGCLRADAVGQEEGSCVTVPSQNIHDTLRKKKFHVPAQNHWCEQFCGSDPGSERIIGRVQRQLFEFKHDVGNSGRLRVKFQYTRLEGKEVIDDAAHCLSVHRPKGMVVVLPCNASDPGQVWHFDPDTKALSVDSKAQCLSIKHCSAVPLDFTSLAGMCDSVEVEKSVAASAAVIAPAATILDRDAGFKSLLPPAGSKDASMVQSLEKSMNAIGWWLSKFGVRTPEEVTKMTFHDIRSTFFAEVTGGPLHKGFLRAWASEIAGYGPQFPIQKCVVFPSTIRACALVRRLLPRFLSTLLSCSLRISLPSLHGARLLVPCALASSRCFRSWSTRERRVCAFWSRCF